MACSENILVWKKYAVEETDEARILADLHRQISGPFTYAMSKYANLDDLFKVVPFEGFCSRVDNIRYLYEEINKNRQTKIDLPSWFVEKYSSLFYRNPVSDGLMV